MAIIILNHTPPTPQKFNVPTISAVTEPIVPKHCCDHTEQITTITVTFEQATFVPSLFVLATFVHSRNISANTDLILMEL